MALQVHQHASDEPERSALAFYYDFASPESYLALEHLAKSLGSLAPELVPLEQRALSPLVPPASTDDERRARIEQLAVGRDLLPLNWPAAWPELDTADAVRAATYAKSIGKVAVYSLSLLRQIFAGGADPADRVTLYLAGAASEIHPRAIDQVFARERTQAMVEEALIDARAVGLTTLPALRIRDELITGPTLLDDPADLLARALEHE